VKVIAALLAILFLTAVILKPQILVVIIIALGVAFFFLFIWALLFGPSIFTK
jgi:hypothetical protein